jgi:fructokinase
MQILCLGELLIDMFPAEVGRGMTEVSSFRPKPGGAPANAAVAAARLGAQSGFIGKVGEDIFGRYLEGVLKQEGVDTRGMRFDTQARTTLVFIAMPDVNTAEFIFYRNPGADMLIDEPIRSATLRAIEIARAAGAMISFDVNYRPALWQSQEAARLRMLETIPQVDLVKVNDTELALLTGSDDLDPASRSLLRKGPKLCVVTLGAKGSFFQTGQDSEFIPGYEVETVDATGCGDAFIASLLFQLVKDGKMLADLSPARLSGALNYANAVGALTSLTQGVIPALPYAHQVEEFLGQRKE